MKKLPENIVKLLGSSNWEDVELAIVLSKQYPSEFEKWLLKNCKHYTLPLKCSCPNEPFKIFRIFDNHYYCLKTAICGIQRNLSKHDISTLFFPYLYTEI